MNKTKIINAIASEIKKRFKNESTGHDWWHIFRVWNTAKKIMKNETCDNFVVELAALLHDIADWKFNNGDDKAGGIEARKLLIDFGINLDIINQVVDIIDTVSYKGAGVETNMKTIEGKIVQDADRLDAIGAIGIARTFAYGGSKGRAMYDPEIKFELHDSFEAYKNNSGPTINHFHEKLLLLKDRMNTKTGKEIAIERHQYMVDYLKQFHNEWNAE